MKSPWSASPIEWQLSMQWLFNVSKIYWSWREAANAISNWTVCDAHINVIPKVEIDFFLAYEFFRGFLNISFQNRFWHQNGADNFALIMNNVLDWVADNFFKNIFKFSVSTSLVNCVNKCLASFDKLARSL